MKKIKIKVSIKYTSKNEKRIFGIDFRQSYTVEMKIEMSI